MASDAGLGITLVIIAAVICCGMYAYGISTAVRRARHRRVQDAQALRWP